MVMGNHYNNYLHYSTEKLRKTQGVIYSNNAIYQELIHRKVAFLCILLYNNFMNSVFFPEISRVDVTPSMFERFSTEDAKKFINFLFMSVVGSDLYSAYLDITVKQIEDDRFDTDESIRDRINELRGAELPFIITADSDSTTGLPTDFHLQRFNPRNGSSYIDGFASFADYENTELVDKKIAITGGFSSFNSEQCDRLLKLTSIQMVAGIDPRVAYGDVISGFGEMPVNTHQKL
jgi:hypothetical protein